jgi:uncharacterized protein (TIGR03437 family)
MMLILVLHGALLAAPPVIQSVLNGASFVSEPIAPQMLVSIIGQNLAASSLIASGFPLPKRLAGSSVTFNGIAAPLLYVSPTQINAQVPTGVQSASQASVIVTTAAGASRPFSVAILSSAVGIFTQNASGCGQLVAFNVHTDGSITMNTPQTSLDPLTDWGLTIFGTGLGAFADRIDGVPWQFNPTDSMYVVTSLANVVLQSQYAGPAPDQVGIDQVNAGIDPDSGTSYTQGCNVPLYLSGNRFSTSQVVNVSVHQGGGVCVDLPESLGLITWQKDMVSSASSPSASDGLNVQFLQSSEVVFPSVPSPGFLTGIPAPPPSSCAVEYHPATLNAGTLTATGFGSSLTLTPQSSNGVLTYQAQLPAGSIEGGAYGVSGSGSAAIGPFTAQAQIPPPISITTNLQPGATVPAGDLALTWTGGDSRSELTIQYIVSSFGKVVASAVGTVNAAAGYADWLIQLFPFPPVYGDVEIIVTQQPSSVPSQPFSAPGLTFGGEQTWSYVFDFQGLTNQ